MRQKDSSDYFKIVKPYEYANINIPSDSINVYSFALHPEQYQPSGSANFSRIDDNSISVRFNSKTSTKKFIYDQDNITYFKIVHRRHSNSSWEGGQEGDGKEDDDKVWPSGHGYVTSTGKYPFVFAQNYNVVRICGGLSSLSYSN